MQKKGSARQTTGVQVQLHHHSSHHRHKETVVLTVVTDRRTDSACNDNNAKQPAPKDADESMSAFDFESKQTVS